MEPRLYRIIDANLNRFKEGVRVVEDIFRYIFDEPHISKELKEIRHEGVYEDENLIKQRDVEGDVLKSTTKSELKKESIDSLIKANMKRSQEAARVLEEIFKLVDTAYSEKFKNLRYRLYKVEKDITLRKNPHSR